MGFIAPHSAHADGVDPDYIVDRSDYDSEHPWFQTAKSSWSMGLRLALDGFPSSSANGNLYQFNFDWIIPYQKLGIFSIGPNLGVLSLKTPNQALTYPRLMNPMIGAQLRYQLKVWVNQFIVPTASLSFDYYRLKSNLPIASYASGTVLSPSFGALINLGWIDSHTAKDSFQSLGITRTYLSAELQQTAFSNEVFSLNAKLYLLGVRVEFE